MSHKVNLDLIHDFVRAKRAQQAAKAELEEAAAYAARLEDQVIREMTEANFDTLSNFSVDGELSTVSIRRQLWVRRKEGVGPADVVQAIERDMAADPELRGLLSYNSSTLSSYLREVMEQREPEQTLEDALPEHLSKVIEDHLRVNAVVTRSTKKASATSRALNP